MALLPVARIKVKHEVSLLRSLTNAFVDVFNNDSTFTLSEVSMIHLTKFNRSASGCNFVTEDSLCSTKSAIHFQGQSLHRRDNSLKWRRNQ